MPVILSELAVERSTLAIDMSFFDEDDAAVIPNAGTVTWTLTDRAGNIINSRENVPITAAGTVTVVLTGDDLAVMGADLERVLTVSCTYDSDLGSGLSFVDAVYFEIQELVAA